MTSLITIRRHNAALAAKIEGQGGFLTLEDVDGLQQVDRLMSVLVRCGNGRFTCAVQDVRHFCGIIGSHAEAATARTGELLNEGTDYVRDVSLLAA